MTIDQRELLRSASRTFALSIERLPGVVGDAMCLAYLLLRVSDFLEDNDYMPAERKVALLKLWDSVLAGDEPAEKLVAELADHEPGDDPDARVAAQADEVLAKVHALPVAVQTQMLVHVRNSTQGMARWVARGPDNICVETDMDDYMHEVAGRVGYLVTDIFAWYSGFVRARLNQLMPLAREFGLALQTVNVIRGLRKDYERGWIFVPESFCAAVNLRRTDLFKPEYQIQALQVVDMVADKAEGHLQKALAYVMALPPWLHTLRLACIWPMLFAVRTLALSRQNVNVLVGEVKMTRDEVKAIVRDTTLFGWSNRWLEGYYKQLKVVRPRPSAPPPPAKQPPAPARLAKA
jgi:farnesyl-diphosphate farnesyltransferase